MCHVRARTHAVDVNSKTDGSGDSNTAGTNSLFRKLETDGAVEQALWEDPPQFNQIWRITEVSECQR